MFTGNFIIHKHNAIKAGLHYDIRLQKNNVLVSWATKNLIQILKNEKSRILLIKQPDHEYNDWINFKGKIPSDEYGGGVVKIFDKGTFECNTWTDKKISLYFFGKKIKGEYTIIKYNKLKNGYLLIKNKEKE